jgi:predicted secreted protein
LAALAALATDSFGVLACERAQAAEADDAPRVSFHVERSREVENDRVTTVLGVTVEDNDPAQVADRVNRSMTWALERARAAPEVKVRSGSYHTFPITDKGKLQRWRARQDLILEAATVEALGDLIGTLQERLQVESMAFSVSDERRREIEQALIAEALAAFRARAEQVRRNLDAAGYEIAELSIDTTGHVRPPRPMVMRGMAAAEAAPPALEAGTSRLQVGVRGTIRLR